jgi:hypothetical protein
MGDVLKDVFKVTNKDTEKILKFLIKHVEGNTPPYDMLKQAKKVKPENVKLALIFQLAYILGQKSITDHLDHIPEDHRGVEYR